MATRNVSVKFSAEISNFKRNMAEAAASTNQTKKASEDASKSADEHLNKLVESATKNRDAWDKVGGAMLGLGATAVTGLGLAGKAAMDWESAWAGVTKTVDGTPAQMDELEASLRGLAKTLPATHEEIAGVAEAAGQLGVKREAVVGFTETMIALGETTNLTADEAATSIAQISNVMGTMEREGSEGVERFAATLVALGNAGASTEAEIVDMAKRIAGAGKLVGASESDVLALANAMASVGIEAQLGGGVISRVMQRMYADVKTGGEGLDGLAKVAGVSSKEFATAFETDPVRAVDMMVKGLGRVKDEGGNVVETMADLGIKGTEETSVLLRLAGAGDLLADSLKLGDEAWASNSALAEEAAKRYETTEAKVQIAWNNIKDAAIEAGAVLLPMIAGIAETASGVAQAFGSLPDPVKGALTALGGVAGVAALGAGAFLTLTPKILDGMNAFKQLAPEGSRAAGALGKVAKAAGALAIAAVGFEAIKALHNSMQPAATSVEEFTQSLVALKDESSAMDSLFADIGATEFEGSINSAGEALDKLINQDFNSAIESFGASIGVDNGMAKLADGITKADQAIASAVSSGNMEMAAKGFKSIADSAADQDISLETVAGRFPEYLDSLRALASEAGVAVSEQDLLNWAMGDVPASMEAAATESDNAAGAIEGVGTAADGSTGPTEEVAKALEDLGIDAEGAVVSLEKFTTALFDSGLRTMSAREATAAHQEAIDGTKGAVEAATKAIEDQLIAEGMGEEAAKALAAEQYKLGGALNKTKTDFDLTSEAGRILNGQFQTVAKTGMAEIEAKAKAGVGQPELQKNLKTTYDSLITALAGMGLTGGGADTLARKVMGIPKKANINTWMDSEAKRMAEETAGAINRIPKNTNIYITTRRAEIITTTRSDSVQTGRGPKAKGPLAHATGGRLPAFADGGQLPTTGPGTDVTDGILGISSLGTPMAWVDAGEWIINGPSSERYNRELAAINAGTFPKLPGYADGARHGREYSAQQLGYAAYSAGGSTSSQVTHNWQITEQSNPVVIAQEVTRRQRMLGV